MNGDPMATSGGTGAADRLSDLVGDALERSPLERGAFLAEACGNDSALLTEVMSLVQHNEAARSFLERPAYALLGDTNSGGMAAGSVRPGEMLGEYRVLSLLGEGGMGEVYLAEDTKLERQVAVKLLKRRLDDDSVAHRFRHERKVLAALTHPNIARLYGGGTTPGGGNYLAMEYVEGERLDRFCEAGKLGVKERLALFRKVCAAVSYAHQNLVVHRDLKPANIRVTPEGEPKLLDFGIAKLLDPEGGASTQVDPAMTLVGAMTPEYASPEQLKGESITTASDVYSLGVVLYELLCGQRPHALKGRRPDELVRAVCEQDPPSPSSVAGRGVTTTATAPGPPGHAAGTREPDNRLRRSLEGDLDNIVAKALRKEPSRRYASVAMLSDDVRRHCEGLPVGARRDTLAYRADKFVRRNKMGVVAVTLIALALVGGLVGTTLETRRANRRFEDVRRLARSILFEIEPQIAELPGSIRARETLVKRALEYLDGLSREAGSRRDLQQELAAAYEKVGDVQGRPDQSNLGNFKGALTSYHKARDLWRALLVADPRDPQARQGLATCEEHIGEILWWSNQTAAAQNSYREALTLWRALVAEQPRSVEYRRGLASVLVRIAAVLSWNAQSSEAVATYREALPILRDLAQATPQETGLTLDLARCLEDFAETQQGLGDYEAALNNLTEAEVIVEPLTRRDPNNQTARRLLWYSLYVKTVTLLVQKATARALEIIPRMLALAEAMAKSDPKEIGGQHNLAISEMARADAYDQAQRWPEALDALHAALTIDTALAKISPDNGEYAHSCATDYSSMGRIRLALGQLAQAESDVRAAQDLLQTAAGRDPENPVPRQDLIRIYELRGDLCERQSQPTEARQWFGRALQELTTQAATNTPPDNPGEWTELRAKLTGKTTAAGTPAPSP